jgi:hypothetical protein
MLTINNLHARVGDKEILRGINLQSTPAKYTPSWGRTVPAKARSLASLPAAKPST